MSILQIVELDCFLRIRMLLIAFQSKLLIPKAVNSLDVRNVREKEPVTFTWSCHIALSLIMHASKTRKLRSAKLLRHA